jgi:hypothetical protein
MRRLGQTSDLLSPLLAPRCATLRIPSLAAPASAPRRCRRRHHLSHAHVQMARELGMNPKKLGKLDNHEQEPWKAPLPQFIEDLYFKRFGRERPEVVTSIEERARAQRAKQAARKEARRRARAEEGDRPPRAPQ